MNTVVISAVSQDNASNVVYVTGTVNSTPASGKVAIADLNIQPTTLAKQNFLAASLVVNYSTGSGNTPIAGLTGTVSI